jgi:hypothetical protein
MYETMTGMLAILRTVVFLTLAAFVASCGSDDDIMSPDRPDTIDDVPRITAENLKMRIDGGDQIMIVDVRSAEDYDEAHIPGAVHIPYSETRNRLQEFSGDRDIVFYCT